VLHGFTYYGEEEVERVVKEVSLQFLLLLGQREVCYGELGYMAERAAEAGKTRLRVPLLCSAGDMSLGVCDWAEILLPLWVAGRCAPGIRGHCEPVTIGNRLMRACRASECRWRRFDAGGARLAHSW
jgi:hypothetical protein